MSTDLSEFHETFFEEAFEAVDGMESALLGLDHEHPDGESVNGIFRGAHSIKGGSAMFGFNLVSSFTHVMETLLDQIRNGKRAVSGEVVDLLLQAVDCLREMLRADRGGNAPDADRVALVQTELERMLAADQAPTVAASDSVAVTDGGDAQKPAASLADLDGQSAGGWKIHFQPQPGMLRTGNDPARIFRELQGLGDLAVRCDSSDLPALADLDPEQCYLSWELELRGTATLAQVEAVFDWVEGDCRLEIEALDAETTPADEASAAGAVRPTDGGAEPPVTAEHSANEPPKAASTSGAATAQATSLRVATDKVDSLINLVGELVITESMLSHFGEDIEHFDASRLEALRTGLAQLDRNTRELQESVMRIRMLPIKFCFSRFPRLVHDLSAKLGKAVELQLHGESTELDKTVLEKINDPLVHAVRNCLDHGIETPEARRAAGKPETGIVMLNAYHAGGNIVIEVDDDGAGLPKQKILAKARERGLIGADEELSDEEIDNLVFAPGFSTAEQVSDVSGRGVGMDVVRRNIDDLGGSVLLRSVEGQGSTLTVRLPLTLAILDGQLVRVGEQTYVISLLAIIESLHVEAERVNTVAGETELYRWRDEYIPVLRLHRAFGVEPHARRLEDGLIVVVESGGRHMGLFVDDLLGQQQVVIKSLASNFKQIPGLAGATILGDGAVALILDVPGLAARYLPVRERRGREAA